MSQQNPKEYDLPFFHENGYIRKKCRVCGQYFWTKNPKFETCQDSPCVEYYFNRIPVKKKLTVSEARTTFLKFFEKRGHKIITPRPVAARWREDLYLTIASIVVFQPHVTNGIVPPPANPLVISQPCIRLEDIDNVGYTFGRHLTIFEMGGHHAFNSEKEKIYWKNETVKYAYEFFTQELGIPEEYIVFKESWWEGGGNAGPSFEVAAGGLELATLVFMQYKIKDGEYQPIPLKIVDTGYGIERISWFTQKTPTAFHSIFGYLVDEFRKQLGIKEPPKEFYDAIFSKIGLLDPDNLETLSVIIEKVSQESGLTRDTIESYLENEAKLFTLLDHTKTIAFMLSDGIVPSNQGEGYLARLVIRRALKTLSTIGKEGILTKLVDMQIEYWSRDFPKLKQKRNYILEVLEIEERKYNEMIKSNLKRALKILSENPTLDKLIKVYQELGIPPEIVAMELNKKNKKINLPKNFYSIIAKEGKPKEIKEQEPPEWIKELPPTERLFHKEPYLSKSKAKVLAVKDNMIVLDQTIVYPTGGGQVSDTGTLYYNGTKYSINKAESLSNVIIHYLDRKVDDQIKPGAIVEIEIDWQRRYRIMRHHTATHVILGSLRKVLGDHVWQAGAEKTSEKGRLDITHYKPIDRQTLLRIEKLANEVVEKRIPVKSFIIDRNTAEEKYGFRLYQGGVPMQKEIRIIEIPGVDFEACFGTHVSNTGEIGGIKIINTTKLQDGIIRLEYVAGTAETEYAEKLEEILETASIMIGGGKMEVPKRIESLKEELKQQKTLINSYRGLVEELLEKELHEKKVKVGTISYYILEDTIGDNKLMTELLQKTTNSDPNLIVFRLLSKNNESLIEISAGTQASKILPSNQIVKELSKKIGGKGGGKPTHSFLRLDRSVSKGELESELKKLFSQNNL